MSNELVTLSFCANARGPHECGCEGRWIDLDGDPWYDDSCIASSDRTYVAVDALLADGVEGVVRHMSGSGDWSAAAPRIVQAAIDAATGVALSESEQS